MAQKRMFDKDIINTDKFADMPLSATGLYFLLGMEADDRGFVSPRRIMRAQGGSEDDLKILIAKGFLIYFESGVVVITDWKKNNWLDSRRIKETEHLEELARLDIVNNRYIDFAKQVLSDGLADAKLIDKKGAKNGIKPLLSGCLADAPHLLRQYSIEESSIEEYRGVYDTSNDDRQTDYTFNYIDKEIDALYQEFGEIIVNRTMRRLNAFESKIGKKVKDPAFTMKKWILEDLNSKKDTYKRTERISNFDDQIVSESEKEEGIAYFKEFGIE